MPVSRSFFEPCVRRGVHWRRRRVVGENRGGADARLGGGNGRRTLGSRNAVRGFRRHFRYIVEYDAPRAFDVRHGGKGCVEARNHTTGAGGLYYDTSDLEPSNLVPNSLFVPLFSPYLMLTRLSLGAAAPWEGVVAIVILALTVPVALWIAARLYRSGVLLYGQAPSPRALWRAIRS